MDQEKEALILLRRKEVEDRVGLTRSALYERVSEGSFPSPITLIGSRTVRWIESEISRWIREQISANREDAQRDRDAVHPAASSQSKLREPAQRTRRRSTANIAARVTP